MILSDFEMNALTRALKAGSDMYHDNLIQRGLEGKQFLLRMTITILDHDGNPIDELRYVEGVLR